MGLKNFYLIPDLSVFETAFLARNEDQKDSSCLKLFKFSWTYFIDSRDKLIIISPQLNKDLIEKHYKSDKDKRQALFTIVRVQNHDEIMNVNCSSNEGQLKLSEILSIEEDRTILFVTDNETFREIINNRGKLKAISSEIAVKLILEGDEEKIREILESC